MGKTRPSNFRIGLFLVGLFLALMGFITVLEIVALKLLGLM